MPLHTDQQVYRSVVAPFKNFTPYRMWKFNRYRSQVADVIAASEKLKDKTDAELRELAASYRVQAVEGRSLESLLVPAFALVRETGRRVLHMAHYPVQILAGIALHRGHMVEVATGEGKTLIGTLPAFLNALSDRGVHVVTVNDYLAKRDAEEMGQVHRFLGLTVGVITNDSKPEERRHAYRCSITYATNKELGFDYLRDELHGKHERWFDFGKSMDSLKVQRVQRPDFNFAIVDEADSILIDEARTPLIIANAPDVDEEAAFEFREANKIPPQLSENVHFTYERKEKKIEWLKEGEKRVTQLLGGSRTPGGHRVDWHESCLRALKAHLTFHRDVDYVVDEGDVVIVDEFTGRKM
ncbi:MAG: DEAD/DEAH box helicase, partial [Planctomycetia bacterium]